jgi:hypothetical protein
MAKDNRDLLTVLKAELEFLEKGGYLHSPSASWRPQFIFEDSLTCMNHDRRVSQLPCSECILMNLVPADCRNVKIPCRHIPLNAEGFTIDTYYRLGRRKKSRQRWRPGFAKRSASWRLIDGPSVVKSPSLPDHVPKPT